MKSLFGFGPTFLAKDLKALGIFCKVRVFFFSSTKEMAGDWGLVTASG